MTDCLTASLSDDMNSMRGISMRRVGVALAEVPQLLGIEELAQPREVMGGQLIMRDDIDRNVRHVLSRLQGGDRCDLFSCGVFRTVELVVALQVDPKLG